MQFVPAHNEMGQPCIYMDMQGLELGVRDVFVPGSESLSDIEFSKLADHCEMFKYFRVDTYNVLKPNSNSYNWDHVFGPANDFLKTLCPDDLRAIAETLIAIHFDIVSEMKYGTNLMTNLPNLTHSFAMQIDQLDRQINLCGKLEDFVTNSGTITIPQFERAGARPQDSPEMTFQRPDVVVLTIFAVLNKLICPVLGVFIEHCKKQIDNSLKELHCVEMLNILLNRRYPEIVNKLKKYIRKITKPNVKEVMKYVVNGFTLELESQKNYANILVRKLVSMNLCREGGNLMTYITASVRECTRTPTFMSVTRGAVEELKNPAENSSMGEEGNASALEFGSRSSDKTVDYPIIIETAAQVFVNNMVKEEEFDAGAFWECVDYYRANLFNITPINTFLVATSYGYELGGAKAIHVLNRECMIQLVALMQFQFIKRGYGNLITIVSNTVTIEDKNIATQQDNHLKTAWNTSFEYRNCKDHFNLVVGTIEWDTQIRKIVDWLIQHNLIVNLPYHITETLKWENVNNKLYQYPDTIIKDICGYVLEVTIGAALQGDMMA